MQTQSHNVMCRTKRELPDTSRLMVLCIPARTFRPWTGFTCMQELQHDVQQDMHDRPACHPPGPSGAPLADRSMYWIWEPVGTSGMGPVSRFSAGGGRHNRAAGHSKQLITGAQGTVHQLVTLVLECLNIRMFC